MTAWLTGYKADEITAFLSREATYGDFFLQAPAMNPNRKQIKGTVAAERISWGMPAYGKPTIVQFAAFQSHVSLYVGEQAIQKFAVELSEITCRKSAIYCGYSQPLPKKLITDMLHWCEEPGV